MNIMDHDTSLAMRAYLISMSFREMFVGALRVLLVIVVLYSLFGIYGLKTGQDVSFGIFWFIFMIFVGSIYSAYTYLKARKKYAEHDKWNIYAVWMKSTETRPFL